MARAKKSQSSVGQPSAVLDLSKPKPPSTKSQPEPQPELMSQSLPEGDFADLGPKRSYRAVVWPIVIAVIVGGVYGGFHFAYASKIYPGVSVNGIAVGGMTKDQASVAIKSSEANFQNAQIPVQFSNTTLAVDLTQIGLSYDVSAAVDEAYSHGHSGSWGSQLAQISDSLSGQNTRLRQFNFDDAKLMPYVNKIADSVDTPVTNAALSFSDSGRVEVSPDQAGQRLDIGRLVESLEDSIAAGSNDSITAPVYSLAPSVSADDLTGLKGQADDYLAGPLTLSLSGVNKTMTVPVKDMIGWLKITQPPANLPAPGITLASLTYRLGAQPVSLSLDNAVIGAYVASLAKSVDQPGQDAALTMDNGQVTVFQPSRTGYTLDQPGAVATIAAGLTRAAGDRSLVLTVKVTPPAVTEANLNSLGINELLAEGVTNFPGSPRDRLTNIRVGAARLNNVLVPPGGTFSAGASLGDIGPENGFVPAIVILANQESLQYGGGLCQVTSTAFRAALLAGLPIVERHPHSFAVGYYTAPWGVPGTDAAINYPEQDFKFKNDTPGYILIQTIFSGTTLKFDFYGTKTKTGRINAPYFVNPAGGAGWNATVPSDTIFTRDVLDLSGNVIKTDTFKSHYQSSLDFPLTKQIN